MKAILIVDIDDELLEDYENFYVDYDLRATNKEDDFVNSIRYVEDCPLKPMPSKKVPDGRETDQIYGCYVGWNACIDEILGETE